MPTGVEFRRASKYSVRKARRGTTSPPTARANCFAAFSRRVQTPTTAPARVNANAAARGENQHAAPLDAEFPHERPKHADVIRVATVERTIAPHHNRIDGANIRRQ